MKRNGRFWITVTLIALGHFALLLALLRWSALPPSIQAESITWIGGGDEQNALPAEEAPAATPLASEEPEPPNRQTEPKSEIELPRPTATPTPEPPVRPKVTATPKPRPSRKSSSPAEAKSSPRKKSLPKSLANKAGAPTAKGAGAADKRAKKLVSTSPAGANAGQGSGLHGTSNSRAQPDTSWYGNMLHDRFYRAWEQPETVVASGVKLSTMVRVRIEKDGRVSEFKIARSSGSMIVDESVQAVGRNVTQVDALPAEFSRDGHYDVNINFALNSE